MDSNLQTKVFPDHRWNQWSDLGVIHSTIQLARISFTYGLSGDVNAISPAIYPVMARVIYRIPFDEK